MVRVERSAAECKRWRVGRRWPSLPAVDRLLPTRVAGPLFVLFLLAVWETLSQLRLVNVVLFPPVTTVLGRFFALWDDSTFPTHLLPTLRRMGLGYAIAAALGISLGTLMGYWRGVAGRLGPLLEFLRPLPPVAVIPAFVLFLGIGDEMKVAVVLFGCFWPILLNTIDGVRGIDPTLVDTARSYGMSGLERIRRIVLPAAAPQIAAGMRNSLSLAVIMMVLAEYFSSTSGVGYVLLISKNTFELAPMWAAILLIGLLGYLLNVLFILAERRFLAWHRGWRAATA